MTTELQIKIFNLVTSGRSYGSVAKELGIGKTTVSSNYLKVKNGKVQGSEIKSKASIPPIEQDATISNTNTVDKAKHENLVRDSPAMNVPPTVILSGPLVELMELMPPNFKGIIESYSQENATLFAWRFACFLSQHHTPVQIITHDLNRLKGLLECDPGHDKLILKNCFTSEQVMNEIHRTTAKIIILDNMLSLKLSHIHWYQIIYFNPDKTIIVVKKQGNVLTSGLNFIARIDTNLLKHVKIETKYGILDFNMGFMVSNLYTCKSI